MALVVKNLPTNVGDKREAGSIPGSEDPLEDPLEGQYSDLGKPMQRGASLVHRIPKSQT